jgi:predicted transcriptional regulator
MVEPIVGWRKEDKPVRKIQLTIDDETVRLLEALAVPRAGNKSSVVREAVRRMAEQEGFEQYLDWLEKQSDVRVSLEGARADERQGRTVSHEQVLRRLQKSRRR